MNPGFNPESFEAQVLQRLTAVETKIEGMGTELSHIKAAMNGLSHHSGNNLVPALSGGLGGGIVLSLVIVGRLLGLW